jgi:CelD/BcsL family acetyltransferase involved in cellulose biosynthesis
VLAHPRASAYHLSAWAAIVGSAYGYAPRYLAIEEAGRLRAVMPLFLGGSAFRGRRLSSMPVARASGPLGDTKDHEAALLDAARERLALEGAQRVIVRSTVGDYAEHTPGWGVGADQPTWVLELPGDAGELHAQLRKRSSNVARGIRRAARSGVRVRESTSRQDLRRFYALYLATMRRHRALPRSLRQLEEQLERLGPPGVFRLFLAELDGALVAGGVFHAAGGVLELLYNGSDEAKLDARPNHALYAWAMEWAIERGLGRFDFGGATEGTSLAAFKAQWGAEPVPIHIYAATADGPVELSGAVAEDGLPGALARHWDRLPLTATRTLGALAYRYG